MTFRRCPSQVVTLVCLFFVLSITLSAREPDANPQAKEPAPPPTIQEQDPLKRPLKPGQEKARREKEGKYYREWEKSVSVIITPEELVSQVVNRKMLKLLKLLDFTTGNLASRSVEDLESKCP